MKDEKLTLILIFLMCIASMYFFSEKTAMTISSTAMGGYLMFLKNNKD